MKPYNSWKKTEGEKLLDIGLGNDFKDMTPEAQITKAKIKKANYVQLKHSASKRNDQQNEKAIYGMGENICKTSVLPRIDIQTM